MWFDRVATFLSFGSAYQPSCAWEDSSSGGKTRSYILDFVHVHSEEFQSGTFVSFVCVANGLWGSGNRARIRNRFPR